MTTDTDATSIADQFPDLPTDEDLQALREYNQELRDKIQENDTDRAESEAEEARRVEALQLLAETARLETQLKASEAAAESVAEGAGSEHLLDNLKDQLSVAVTQAQAPAGAVDTNSGYVEPEAPKQPDTVSTDGEGDDKGSGTPPTPPTESGTNVPPFLS